MSPRADLDRCGNSIPHRDSIPGPSSSQRVPIPTDMSRSTTMRLELNINFTSGVLEKKHPTNGDHSKDDAVTETRVFDRICTFYPVRSS
jgi:hypothetical protein